MHQNFHPHYNTREHEIVEFANFSTGKNPEALCYNHRPYIVQRNPICSLRELHTGNPISLKVTKCFFLLEIRLAGKYFLSNLNASFSILYWTNCPSPVTECMPKLALVFLVGWVKRLANNCCSRLMAPSFLKPFMIISQISTLPPFEGCYIFRPKKKGHYICFKKKKLYIYI